MRLQTSGPDRGPVPASRQLRDQLQEMTAAAYALASTLTGQEKALRYLAVIDRGLCRQRRLLRQLELAHRLSSQDEIRLFLAPVDLAQLCGALMDQTDTLVAPLDICARLRTSLTTLPTMADRDALEEMLLALIANSVSAIQAAGRPGDIQLELEQRDRNALLTLTDNGCGMEEEALADLFQDQDDDDPDLEISHHGLSLARRIAALHGGSMVVEARGGQGFRLAISLPLLEKVGGVLHSPALPQESDRVLVALSDCLPPESFLPEAHDQ